MIPYRALFDHGLIYPQRAVLENPCAASRVFGIFSNKACCFVCKKFFMEKRLTFATLMVLASREASETFIAREIEALQKRGLPLVVATLAELKEYGFLTRGKRSALLKFFHFLRFAYRGLKIRAPVFSSNFQRNCRKICPAFCRNVCRGK